jgi:hypothetical protein
MLQAQGDRLGQGHFAVELECSFGQLIGFLHGKTSLSIFLQAQYTIANG